MHIVIDNLKFQPFASREKAQSYADKYCKPGAIVRECVHSGFVIQTSDQLIDDALVSPVNYTASIADQLFKDKPTVDKSTVPTYTRAGYASSEDYEAAMASCQQGNEP